MAPHTNETLAPAETPASPPSSVLEYAETCVQYVQAATAIPLDYEPETLPLLDHYLRGARDQVQSRPESLPLVATVAGSYLGELLRRRHKCHWRIESKEPLEWFLDFDDTPVIVRPIAIAWQAITAEMAPEVAAIQVDEPDKNLVAEYLAELPAVSDEEFLAPSTRVEVVDIIIDLIRARRASENSAADQQASDDAKP